MQTILQNFTFDISVEQIPDLVQTACQDLKHQYDQLEQIPLDQVTYQNLVEQLSMINAETQPILNVIPMLQDLAVDSDLREACRQADEDIRNFNVENSLRPKLYDRVKMVRNREGGNLNPEEDRLLNCYLMSFEQSGLHLRKPRRDRLEKLTKEKNSLMIDFGRNSSEDTTYLMFDESELVGVPMDVLDKMRTEEGQYKVTYKYPDITPILDHCEVAETRRRVMEMDQNRCLPNLRILTRLHEIRTQIARELGYSNSVDHRTSEEMISTGSNAYNFLQQVLTELDPVTKEYVNQLSELKMMHQQESKKRRRVDSRNLEAWDYNFYHNLYLKNNYSLNVEEIRQYFPCEHVFDRMLSFYEEVFHLEFTKVVNYQSVPSLYSKMVYQNVPVPWHSDVITYRVDDYLSEEPLGLFYLDLYPREGKQTHFYMSEIISGYQNQAGEQVLPVAMLVGNWPKPSETSPSLLTMDEVSTLFHEFGHVIHGICGGARNRYFELAGTCTETDFVEAPSQMKEQWVYEPMVLRWISKHYQTGEVLPDTLINRITQTRTIGLSREWSRVSSMALVDNLIHTEEHLTKKRMIQIMQDTMEKYLHQPYGSGNRIATWGHMGSYDYDSKYYSYVWTMVLACDLYSRFVDDPGNSRIGLEYRRKILEPGGTKDGIEMIRDFLGREPNLGSFLSNYIGKRSHRIRKSLDLNID